MNIKHALAVAATLALASTASWGASTCTTGANLIVNCGFERGDFSGWTLAGQDVPDAQDILYGVEGQDPYPTALGGTAPAGGDWQAFFSSQTDETTTLSQSVATTIGATYTVSFALAQYDVNAPYDSVFTNALTASFGGSTLLALTDSADFGYTAYSYQVVATAATSTFSLALSDTTGEFLVDELRVAPVSSVPEPASAALMAAGLLALGVVARSRLRNLGTRGG